jgi:predicted RNase H-like HicB family nuclease
MDRKITCWEEDGGWIGYLDGHPDYWTQGDTLEDLLAHLQDLHKDLSAGSG